MMVVRDKYTTCTVEQNATQTAVLTYYWFFQIVYTCCTVKDIVRITNVIGIQR